MRAPSRFGCCRNATIFPSRPACRPGCWSISIRASATWRSAATRWPGGTPQDVEKEIVIEQEEYLRSIPSLERIISRASSGEARIELEFPYNIDLNETLIRINNALSQVPSYPEDVDQPRVRASSFSANSFMYFRVSPLPGNPRQLDMDMMRDFVDDNVRARLESVTDVSDVG